MAQPPPPDLDALRAVFERSAREHFQGVSPLYERLAAGIARDPDLLALAAGASEGQSAPLLLLAAVHFLLLDAPGEPLAAWYPGVAGGPPSAGDPLPAFRAFCRARREELGRLLAERLVQTNEVGRCACLLPAFGLAAHEAGGRPLALVEIGASAGLNLLWDRYGYDYGASRRAGDPRSPVQLACEVRGGDPPIPATLPALASRVGTDLRPVDIHDSDEARWLRALIWPEQRERAAVLERALDMARRDPPRVVAGEALDVLPDLLAAIPPDATPCLVHTFALYEFPDEARERLLALLTDEARRRPFVRVGLEWQEDGADPILELVAYADGAGVARRLARCDTHGAWLRWGDDA